MSSNIFGENMSFQTYEKIICFLAHHEKATQYDIARDKEVGLSYAPVHQAIEELLFLDLIEEVEKEKGQGPLPKRYFRLTFSGVATALALFSLKDKAEGVDPKIKRALRKTILTYRKLYPDFKLFSEWEFLEKTFGDDIYIELEATSISWFRIFDPLSRPKAKWLKSELREELRQTFLIDQEWLQHNFVRIFLQGFISYLREDAPEHTLRGTPNAALYKFIKAFFEKERKRKIERLKKMEKAEKRLLTQFSVI